MPTEPIGVYLHVPFCAERCAYCNFAIVTRAEHRTEEYAVAVVEEARSAARQLGERTVETLHIGGGTPSRLPAPVIEGLVRESLAAFGQRRDAEIALEANPEDATPARLVAWLEAGVTRLTIGLQSLDERGLASIGRPGSVTQGMRALAEARKAGFSDLGADVIFGRPGQSLHDWHEELQRMSDLDVDHWSCYALETDARTPLLREIDSGRVPPPDPDLQADMYEMAREVLGARGFVHYEISNFARPGHASRHNLKYWTDQPYVGLGQSAASYVDGRRWVNPRRFSEYVRRARSGSGPARVEEYEPDARAGEAIVFGLRLIDGVDLSRVSLRHGVEPVRRRRAVMDAAAVRGLLAVRGSRLKLTDRGRLIADEVFVDLL
jgi:oxygen-independent coproporphyrinogen-3 oxidase